MGNHPKGLNSRNKVYVGTTPTETELEETKKEMYEYALIFADSILVFPAPLKLNGAKTTIVPITQEVKERVVRAAIDHVFLRYNPKSGMSLGGTIKQQISADLEVEYNKLGIKTKNPPEWPHHSGANLGEPRVYKRGSLSVSPFIEGIKGNDKLIAQVRHKLKDRRQKVLDFFLSRSDVTYHELRDALGISLGTAFRDVKYICKVIRQCSGEKHG